MLGIGLYVRWTQYPTITRILGTTEQESCSETYQV